ncbi:MAG: hypothetical protein B7X11_01545, partial [Acidobacteria bacterium 37-65-4]
MALCGRSSRRCRARCRRSPASTGWRPRRPPPPARTGSRYSPRRPASVSGRWCLPTRRCVPRAARRWTTRPTAATGTRSRPARTAARASRWRRRCRTTA